MESNEIAEIKKSRIGYVNVSYEFKIAYINEL